MTTNNFQLEYEGYINDKIPVTKFSSISTGIKIVFAEVVGPMVQGYFCLATEASDDNGLPHTLEHLIFLGSEDYPYKGVLDQVATISMSEGTNASTDKDHTCYTVTTAGCEGFLQLLPVYLDHILYPKLTDSAYTTEIHHITGEGKDAGVLYSEIQDTENTGSNMVFLEVLRNIYPKDSGYRFDTGGIMKNIRNSTNIAKVREFHRRYYVPKNLCLIITGTIDHQQLFTVLSEFEKKINSKAPSNYDFSRPWMTKFSSLNSSLLKTIKFPSSDDDDDGIVVVAWKGPMITNQTYIMALRVLLDYLTESPVALLNQAFVEISRPLCGEISHTIMENNDTIFSIEFGSVPLKSIKNIHPKLLQLLHDLGEKKIKMNMDRIKTIINNSLVNMTNQLEDDPHETVAALMIDDFLYGTGKSDLEDRLQQAKILKSLQDYPDTDWVDFLKSYMIRGHNVTIIGKPCPKLAQTLAEKNGMRIDSRKDKLGKEGLEEKKRMLINAINENNTPHPKQLLSRFSIPSTHSLQYHTIKSYHNSKQFASTKADYSIADLDKIPCCFQLDDIKTEFLSINLCIDLQRLPKHLVLYLPIYVELLFESPIIRNGEEISYEKVIKELEKETMEYTSSLGIQGSRFNTGEFASSIIINLKVERSKFETGVKWCGELLTSIRFTPDRISAVAKKLLSDIKQQRREAEEVADAVSIINIFKKNSIPYCSSILVQKRFLKTLSTSASFQSVIHLEEIQRNLMSLENIYINMATDVEKLNRDLNGRSFSEVWIKNFIQSFKGTPTTNHKMGWKLKNDINVVVDPRTIDPTIVGMSSESAYLIQVAKTFSGFDHPDVPALLVFCHFVSFLEGPMWKMIRGMGLAYSFGMAPDFDEGLLYFRIGQSPDIYQAYEQALGLLKNIIDGSKDISNLEINCAKCQCLYELIQSVETPNMASKQAFSCFMRTIPLDYHRDMMHKIQEVTKKNIIQICQDYIKNLLKVETSTLFIICNVKEVKVVAQKFGTLFKRKFTMVNKVSRINLKK